jgi:hypothetical protein
MIGHVIYSSRRTGNRLAGRTSARAMRRDVVGLCGHGGCAGEVRCQELPGPVQGIGRFVEDRVEILEDVRHLGGQVEGDRDVGGGALLREADGVVQEDLVRPGPG